MKCCICGKEFEGWGNNPYGAIDDFGNTVEWDPDDECCDDCNINYVVFGRLVTLSKNKKYN